MSARREFLKKIISLSAFSGAFLLAPAVFSQVKKKKKGEEVDPNTCFAKPGVDGAAEINYETDRSKVSAAAKAKADNHPTVKFAKQDCANCILFQGGACTIITKGCKKVDPKGWCPTWTHNPKAS